MIDIEREQFSFGELVDMAAFSKLLESFYKATGIPNGLVGPDGELISQAGWTSACAKFHRVHPETERRCQQSNIELMGKLNNGEVSGCMCGNGLLDYATPVVVEGKQLATLFLGQVLNEPPDPNQFRRQARQFGFDEQSYLDAIRAVPIISRENLEAKMDHLVAVAQVLATSGLALLREQRLQQDLERSNERQIELEDLLNLSPVGIGWSDSSDKIEYINAHFTELFGYTLADMPDLETWYRKAYPDPEYREQVVEPWRQAVAEAHRNGTPPPTWEVTITCKDGSVRHVMIRAAWVGNKRLVNFSDITAHWRSEQRNRAHDLMLEMVAKGRPLTEILHAIVRAIESEEPSALCSVLLTDAERKHLINGAAPSLPDFYNEAIEGIDICMGVGSCGTAAFLGERVIVDDVSTHAYWQPFAELAQRSGLGSCWSEPILSTHGQVLGTFAIYHAGPAVPNPEDIDRITFAANLAAIAIENRNTQEELEAREREFRTLAENAPENIARYDLKGRLLYANPSLERTLGVTAEKAMGRRPEEHDEVFANYETQLFRVIKSGEALSFEIEIPTLDGVTFHMIQMVAERDESGATTGVLAMGRDITERKQIEERLATREREFRTLAENAPDNIARYDTQGRYVYVNPRLEQTLGRPGKEMLGLQTGELLTGYEHYESQLFHVLKSGEEASFEIEVTTPDGEVCHSIQMVAERDESGAISGVLAIGRDMTERKRMEQELERQAHFDFLTGLANRRYFLERAESEIARCSRYDDALSLIMFDIDYFKAFNDTYGHNIGDRVLQRVAELTRTTVRTIDLVGRIGGEEFVVLLPHTDCTQAAETVERLHAAIDAGKLEMDEGAALNFTASFGVVTMTEKSADIDLLLAQADAAMYQAKEQGRNRVCSYKG